MRGRGRAGPARAALERDGRRVHRAARRVPRGRRVRARSRRASSSRTRSSSCTGARATAAPRSRTRSSSLGENAHATVLDRFGSPQTDHLVDAVTELIVDDNAHLRYLSVQEHGPQTWHLGLHRAHVGRDASLRTSAVALGGDYARLRSEALLTRRGCRERPARGVLRRRRADARLPHAPGPRRAAYAQRPAVQGRGRGRRPFGVLGARPVAADGAEVERVPDEPQSRAHRRRGRGVDPEPRDRGQRRAVLARLDRRPDRRRAALLPRDRAASRPKKRSG